jgi:uncharacterized protein (DUF2141 family)
MPFRECENPEYKKQYWSSPVRFLNQKKVSSKFLKFASKTMLTQIISGKDSFEFSDIGKYAIAVIHDENCNGELDSNLWDTNRRLWFFQWRRSHNECPSFSDAVFSYDGGHLQMSISS